MSEIDHLAAVRADGDALAAAFWRRRMAHETADGAGERLHLRATDAEGERRRLPAGVQVDGGPAEAGAGARGTASDLLPFLWARAPATRLETWGGPAVLAAVRALAAKAAQ